MSLLESGFVAAIGAASEDAKEVAYEAASDAVPVDVAHLVAQRHRSVVGATENGGDGVTASAAPTTRDAAAATDADRQRYQQHQRYVDAATRRQWTERGQLPGLNGDSTGG